MLQEARGDVASHPAYRRYHYAYGPLSVTDAAGTRFIGTDALGSPTDLTTTTGTVAAAHQYDAWGQYRNGTAPSAEEPKLGYTGHQFDPETGLVYARARYYDPEIGIFISRDTYEGELEDGPSLHRYAYAYGNPVMYADDDGHSATAVGAVAGFFWGFGQMVGGMATDVYNCSAGNRCTVRSTGDYLSVWGQNIIGGAELGASIDVTVGSGGLLATSAGGALGFAGFDALTFDGQAKGWKDFGVSQAVEGGKGAILGPAFGTAFKVGGTALRWAGGTGAGQWTARVGKEAIGKLASTRVGQAVAQFATKAGERVAGTARAAGGWLGREGAALDAAAAEVGLGKAVQAPKALGQALGNLENRATQAVANAFRPAAPVVPRQTLAERAAMAPETYELESTLEAWGARNAQAPATDGTIALFHGTTANRGSKIALNGFRGGKGDAVFFADEISTARHFAEEAAAMTGARSVNVLRYTMNRGLAQELGLSEQFVLGQRLGAPPIDIPGASGFERVISGPQIGKFNQALRAGLIRAKRYRYPFGAQ